VHVSSYHSLSCGLVFPAFPQLGGGEFSGFSGFLAYFSTAAAARFLQRAFSALALAHGALSVISKLDRLSPSVASLAFPIVSLALA
jgi:hypothetical protein